MNLISLGKMIFFCPLKWVENIMVDFFLYELEHLLLGLPYKNTLMKFLLASVVSIALCRTCIRKRSIYGINGDYTFSWLELNIIITNCFHLIFYSKITNSFYLYLNSLYTHIHLYKNLAFNSVYVNCIIQLLGSVGNLTLV